MPPTDAARADIQKLVDRYNALTPTERRRRWGGNELQTCQDWVTRLFRALGWQTWTDSQGKTDAFQQVSAGRGRVDYAFKDGNVTRFLLEAKHLEEDMTKPQWANQAVSYAYNKGLRWVVLTNFKSVQVFNALREGNPSDHCVLNLDYSQFVPEIDRLWRLSKEAFFEHTLDNEAIMTGGAPPREPVERKLASVLKKARQDLYNQLLARFPQMPEAEIDDLIQSLLNRLVFIRTAEDRGFEDPNLRQAVNSYKSGKLKSTLLDEVIQIFAYYANGYDSDLFPRIADRWTSTYVDDAGAGRRGRSNAPIWSLSEIISNLYRPDGSQVEFDFSAISADALGQIYEQYLGFEVKKSTAGPQPPSPGMPAPTTTVETVGKREARRKRGVYYTPGFVVDYLVRHTVEKLIFEEDPDRLADVRIADIACGSGSFLIRAYDVLLDALGPSATQAERLDLLRRSIYGVDLDPHAIDVARLNLLIRALASPMQLPMLRDNLLVRNSLIHGDANSLRAVFGNDWAAKRRFNFDETFPQVAAEGGFDIILGNPPYVEIQTQDKREREFIKKNYRVEGSFDVYVPFIERALELLRPDGRVGFIVPHKFMSADYGKKLRQLLGDMGAIEEIVHFGDQQVFDGVTTYTCMLVLRKDGAVASTRLIRPAGLDSAGDQDRDRLAETVAGLDKHLVPPGCSVESGSLPHPKGSAPWSLVLGPAKALCERLAASCEPLNSVSTHIFTGLQTSADHIYHLQRTAVQGPAAFKRYKNAPNEPGNLGAASPVEEALMRPLLSGEHVERYRIQIPRTYLLFPYSVKNRQATLIPASTLSGVYPNAWRYLKVYEAVLRSREANDDGRPFDDDDWYRFGRNQNLGLHNEPKLAVPRLVSRLSAAIDFEGEFCLDNVDVGGILFKTEDEMLWVAAMLNSKVLDFVFQQQDNTFRGGTRSANRQFIQSLPIPSMERDGGLTTSILKLARDMARTMRAQSLLKPEESARRVELHQQFNDQDTDMEKLVADAYELTQDERDLVYGT